jgi:glycosyltransferase involved in cell wall biosynthesis
MNLFVYDASFGVYLMRSILIHDWLTSSVGGGENVLEAIHRLLPSPIYTLLCDKNKLKNSYFEHLDIKTSFIQNLPLAKTQYRNYLPFFPTAIEQFDVRDFDLILSSSHCVAKGVITHKNQLHISYCHTPMRYAWDMMDAYLKDASLDSGLRGKISKKILEHLRAWDVSSSQRVDYFIANSHFVAERIKKYYGRNAQVIYPPVNTHLYPLEEKKEDYYITVSRLVPYKKVDLIVAAFSHMPNKKLLVIGDGPERKKIERTATKNIEFLGFQPSVKMREYVQKAKGFVFAAIEDFGIAPVEAMAAGTPVIAYGEGGSLETVLPEITGHFFFDQSASSLIDAVKQFEEMAFDPKQCSSHAEQFSHARFCRQFQTFVLDRYIEFKNKVL